MKINSFDSLVDSLDICIHNDQEDERKNHQVCPRNEGGKWSYLILLHTILVTFLKKHNDLKNKGIQDKLCQKSKHCRWRVIKCVLGGSISNHKGFLNPNRWFFLNGNVRTDMPTYGHTLLYRNARTHLKSNWKLASRLTGNWESERKTRLKRGWASTLSTWFMTFQRVSTMTSSIPSHSKSLPNQLLFESPIYRSWGPSVCPQVGSVLVNFLKM